MTDKEIKHNAEDYYSKLDSITIEVENEPNSIIEAYTVGAHSRDEEIKDLEARIYMLEKAIKVNEYFEEAKLDQLRNPWISVEEKLPRKLQNKDYSKEVLCRTEGGTLLVSIYNHKKREWIDGMFIKITHWMPIPELKKGE